MKLISTYIIRQFIATFVFALSAICIIFMIVNLIENLDKFIDQKAGFLIIVKYYIYYFPDILKILTPVGVLLSVLFTIGKLSSTNEITAIKTGGMSLYKLMLPLGTLCIILSLGQLYFNGWIVPKANHYKFDIEQKYLKENSTNGPIYNLYFRDSPTRNVIMQYYDASQKSGNTVAIEDYSSEKHPRMVRRIEAKRIVWDSLKSSWLLTNGIDRTFDANNINTIPFQNEYIKLIITHKQIVELKRSPDEMNFDEFRNYLKLLRQGGKDIRRQLIEYYSDYSFPFANFIIILFAVPFASVRRKGGIAIQIAAAMIVSFAYLVFTEVGQTIGYAENMNPILAGWMANIIFLFAGLVVLFRTRT